MQASCNTPPHPTLRPQPSLDVLGQPGYARQLCNLLNPWLTLFLTLLLGPHIHFTFISLQGLRLNGPLIYPGVMSGTRPQVWDIPWIITRSSVLLVSTNFSYISDRLWHRERIWRLEPFEWDLKPYTTLIMYEDISYLKLVPFKDWNYLQIFNVYKKKKSF